jgi:prolyl oligopeptidase PreP (S9A serine peptidase family)
VNVAILRSQMKMRLPSIRIKLKTDWMKKTNKHSLLCLLKRERRGITLNLQMKMSNLKNRLNLKLNQVLVLESKIQHQLMLMTASLKVCLRLKGKVWLESQFVLIKNRWIQVIHQLKKMLTNQKHKKINHISELHFLIFWTTRSKT